MTNPSAATHTTREFKCSRNGVEYAARGDTLLLRLADKVDQGGLTNTLKFTAAAIQSLNLGTAERPKQILIDVSQLQSVSSEVVGQLFAMTRIPDVSIQVYGANETVHQRLVSYGMARVGSKVKLLNSDTAAPVVNAYGRAPTNSRAVGAVFDLAGELDVQSREKNLLLAGARIERPDIGPKHGEVNFETVGTAVVIHPCFSDLPEQTGASSQFNRNLDFIVTAAERTGAIKRIVLDCSGITGGMGADAVGALVKTYNAAKAIGCEFVLREVKGPFREVLRISHLDRLLTLEPATKAA